MRELFWFLVWLGLPVLLIWQPGFAEYRFYRRGRMNRRWAFWCAYRTYRIGLRDWWIHRNRD